MRDRLTQLIHDAHMAIADRDDDRDTYTAIADYLLDNGVIVPPCKLGDKYYRIRSYGNAIVEQRVSMITQKADGSFKIRLSYNGRVADYTEDDLRRWCKSTREEAEAALKAREQT